MIYLTAATVNESPSVVKYLLDAGVNYQVTKFAF